MAQQQASRQAAEHASGQGLTRISDQDNPYPVPEEYPEYQPKNDTTKGQRKLSVYTAIDALFIVITLALTAWYLALMVINGFNMETKSLIWVVWWFLVLAYLSLPRMHQLFTFVYVPDYFVARARTSDGLLGDPVNIALHGSEEDIHAVLLAAGWTKADKITLRSSWKIAVSSVFRKSYPAAPVSPLVIFKRSQAFAYQQEDSGSASKRHHVRLWRTPDDWALPGGEKVPWMAGATYDRGVGLSSFTGQITHKIDEDTDAERDYLIGTLQYVDPETTVKILPDFSSPYICHNGGGDKIVTDGDLPIVDVTGAAERLADVPEVREGVQARKEEAEASRKRDKELPPAEMNIVGALTAIVAIFTAWRSGTQLANIGWVTGSLKQTWVLYGHFVGALAALLFLALTFMRIRWARVLLMITITLISVGDLLAAGTSEHHVASNLFMVAVALVLVMSISSESSRRWVSGDRADKVVSYNLRHPNRGVSVE